MSAVVDALDEAFYATCQNVEPRNKPVLLALDASGSMAGSMIAGSCVSAREGSAAMALIRAATEPEFQHGIPISPKQPDGHDSPITVIAMVRRRGLMSHSR